MKIQSGFFAPSHLIYYHQQQKVENEANTNLTAIFVLDDVNRPKKTLKNIFFIKL